MLEIKERGVSERETHKQWVEQAQDGGHVGCSRQCHRVRTFQACCRPNYDAMCSGLQTWHDLQDLMFALLNCGLALVNLSIPPLLSFGVVYLKHAIEFLNYLLLFYMSILCACLYSTMCTQCLWKLEDGTRFPGIGVTDRCEPSCGAENWAPLPPSYLSSPTALNIKVSNFIF